MNTLPIPARPTVGLTTDGSAAPVLDLLTEYGWTLVTTPEANVHCTSPDRQVYVGWLPEDTAAWRRGILWTIQATPTEAKPWVQEFGPDVPSPAIALFLQALLGTRS